MDEDPLITFLLWAVLVAVALWALWWMAPHLLQLLGLGWWWERWIRDIERQRERARRQAERVQQTKQRRIQRSRDAENRRLARISERERRTQAAIAALDPVIRRNLEAVAKLKWGEGFHLERDGDTWAVRRGSERFVVELVLDDRGRPIAVAAPFGRKGRTVVGSRFGRLTGRVSENTVRRLLRYHYDAGAVRDAAPGSSATQPVPARAGR